MSDMTSDGQDLNESVDMQDLNEATTESNFETNLDNLGELDSERYDEAPEEVQATVDEALDDFGDAQPDDSLNPTDFTVHPQPGGPETLDNDEAEPISYGGPEGRG